MLMEDAESVNESVSDSDGEVEGINDAGNVQQDDSNGQEDDDDIPSECPELTTPDEHEFDYFKDISLRHLPCLAHTLQLVIKPVYKHYSVLLTKTRSLISRVRKSGAIMEKLISACGKSLISDCTTRWSSTYTMVKRLVTIRIAVNDVFTELGKLLTDFYPIIFIRSL